MAAPSLHLLLGLRRGLLLPGLRGNIAWRVSAAVLQQAAGYQVMTRNLIHLVENGSVLGE